MADRIISLFADLHEAVEPYNDLTVVYRGARSLTYTLTPTVGRYAKLHSKDRLKEERAILRLFREQAVP